MPSGRQRGVKLGFGARADEPVAEAANGAEESAQEGVAPRSPQRGGLDGVLELGIGEVARVAVAAETAAQAIRSRLAAERQQAEEEAELWQPDPEPNGELQRAERIGGSLIEKLRGVEDHCHRLLDRLEEMERRRAGGGREEHQLIATRMAAEGSSREEIEAFLRNVGADQPVEVARTARPSA